MSEYVTTPEFRMSYPNVYKARLNQQNQKMEYSVLALFPAGTDFSKMKAAAKEACIEKFGADQSKWPKNFKNPFRKTKNDGTTPEGLPEGGTFMTFKGDRRPGVVDRSRKDLMDENEIYGGAWGYAAVVPYAFNQKGNAGVAFGLRMLQKSRDDEAFGGTKINAEEAFEALPEDNSGGGEVSETSADSIF